MKRRNGPPGRSATYDRVLARRLPHMSDDELMRIVRGAVEVEKAVDGYQLAKPTVFTIPTLRR
jgi:hypothetical protein